MRRFLYIFIPILLILGSCGIRTDLFHIAGSSLQVYSYDPVNTDLSIPTNAIVSVAFSEILDTWSVENAFSIEFDGQTFTSEDGWFEWFAEDRAFGFHFDPDHFGGDDPYPLGTDITVRIDGDVRDREGFYLTEPLEWTFTTSAGADFTDPTVLSWAPVYSEQISGQAHLEILFSEPMNRITLAAGLALTSSDGQDIRTIENGFFLWSDNNTMARYYPKELLQIGKDYWVVLDVTSIIPRDLAGNELFAGDRTHPYPSYWADSIKIVVDPLQVPEELADFPVYIDLSEMTTPAPAFFSDVLLTGDDIAIINGDRKQVLPRELVYLDRPGGNGELWFKAPKLSSSEDTVFYLLYNNPFGGVANTPDVWSNGFAGVYHLHGNFIDSSPHNHNATAVDTLDQLTKIGRGREFDGIDDLIDIPFPDIVKKDGTVSLWIRPFDWGMLDERTIFDATLPPRPFFLDIQLGGQLRFKTSDSSGNEYEVTKNVSAYAPATWHHLTGTWQYKSDLGDTITAPAINMYLDGDFVGQSGGVLSTLPALNSPFIGHTRADFQTLGKILGVIDEIHISDVRRTPGWVKTQYNNQNAPWAGGFFKTMVYE